MLHCDSSITTDLPIGTSKLCFRDCLVFLLRGEFIIKGQGLLSQTGCAYRIKDEVWLWLWGRTTIVIMEEGEMKGECLRSMRETQALLLAQREGSIRERKRATKLLNEKFRARASTAALHRPWVCSPPDVSPQNPQNPRRRSPHRPWECSPPDVSPQNPQNPRRRSNSLVVNWYNALLTFISPKKN